LSGVARCLSHPSIRDLPAQLDVLGYVAALDVPLDTIVIAVNAKASSIAAPVTNAEAKGSGDSRALPLCIIRATIHVDLSSLVDFVLNASPRQRWGISISSDQVPDRVVIGYPDAFYRGCAIPNA
jgi:hypothetical protein